MLYDLQENFPYFTSDQRTTMDLYGRSSGMMLRAIWGSALQRGDLGVLQHGRDHLGALDAQLIPSQAARDMHTRVKRGSMRGLALCGRRTSC